MITYNAGFSFKTAHLAMDYHIQDQRHIASLFSHHPLPPIPPFNIFLCIREYNNTMTLSHPLLHLYPLLILAHIIRTLVQPPPDNYYPSAVALYYDFSSNPQQSISIPLLPPLNFASSFFFKTVKIVMSSSPSSLWDEAV